MLIIIDFIPCNNIRKFLCQVFGSRKKCIANSVADPGPDLADPDPTDIIRTNPDPGEILHVHYGKLSNFFSLLYLAKKLEECQSLI